LRTKSDARNRSRLCFDHVLRGDPQASHRLATLCSQASEKRCRS
jgi:hypothetical protein